MSETRKIAAILVSDVVGYSSPYGRERDGHGPAVREYRETAGPLHR
jgi:hypothetical protein